MRIFTEQQKLLMTAMQKAYQDGSFFIPTSSKKTAITLRFSLYNVRKLLRDDVMTASEVLIAVENVAIAVRDDGVFLERSDQTEDMRKLAESLASFNPPIPASGGEGFDFLKRMEEEASHEEKKTTSVTPYYTRED